MDRLAELLENVKINEENLDGKKLLEGIIDFHIHSAPSVNARVGDDLDVALRAKADGMGGIVLKAHEGDTAARALLTQRVTGLNVYGGLVLNEEVGGINPRAVETSLKLGAKIIWMPTVSADYHMYIQQNNGENLLDYAPGMAGGITIVNERGHIRREVKEVLKIVATYDAILATGHLSAVEINLLVDEAARYNVKKIVINHPDLKLTYLPISTQINLAQKGAYMEKCLIALTPSFRSLSIAEMVASINAIGANKCLISTDFGQAHHPFPNLGMAIFIRSLVEEGISDTDIKIMGIINPLYLLNGE